MKNKKFLLAVFTLVAVVLGIFVGASTVLAITAEQEAARQILATGKNPDGTTASPALIQYANEVYYGTYYNNQPSVTAGINLEPSATSFAGGSAITLANGSSATVNHIGNVIYITANGQNLVIDSQTALIQFANSYLGGTNSSQYQNFVSYMNESGVSAGSLPLGGTGQHTYNEISALVSSNNTTSLNSTLNSITPINMQGPSANFTEEAIAVLANYLIESGQYRNTWQTGSVGGQIMQMLGQAQYLPSSGVKAAVSVPVITFNGINLSNRLTQAIQNSNQTGVTATNVSTTGSVGSQTTLSAPNDPQITVRATPVTFTGGRWTYNFSWTRLVNPHEGMATVALGANPDSVVAQSDPAPGIGSFTANLNPATNYVFRYYSYPSAYCDHDNITADPECAIIASISFTTVDQNGNVVVGMHGTLPGETTTVVNNEPSPGTAQNLAIIDRLATLAIQRAREVIASFPSNNGTLPTTSGSNSTYSYTGVSSGITSGTGTGSSIVGTITSAFPKTITVNVNLLNIRNNPDTAATVIGQLRLGQTFVATGVATGETVHGENRWWAKQGGGYAWVGGTDSGTTGSGSGTGTGTGTGTVTGGAGGSSSCPTKVYSMPATTIVPLSTTPLPPVDTNVGGIQRPEDFITIMIDPLYYTGVSDMLKYITYTELEQRFIDQAASPFDARVAAATTEQWRKMLGQPSVRTALNNLVNVTNNAYRKFGNANIVGTPPSGATVRHPIVYWNSISKQYNWLPSFSPNELRAGVGGNSLSPNWALPPCD